MFLRSRIGGYVRKIFGYRFYTYVKMFLPEHRYLWKIRGIIHIGANTGQERNLYNAFGLRVLWIEPIPTVFETLASNISSFPNQRALKALVAAEDGKSYQFHIANNGGESSSSLDLSKVREMFPEIDYVQTITLSGARLGTILNREGIDVSQYQAIVLDTQGSEGDILRGASDLLGQFKFIQAEVADFEAYKDCSQLGGLSAFMSTHGFREKHRHVFSHVDGVGTYFDVLYQHS